MVVIALAVCMLKAIGLTESRVINGIAGVNAQQLSLGIKASSIA